MCVVSRFNLDSKIGRRRMQYIRKSTNGYFYKRESTLLDIVTSV